jgi:RHH-type proline utilization regulon transcriptional repressor/proline dehydrogenase/delta 1-pyrroline-5-carboxylate dehydrogenase
MTSKKHDLKTPVSAARSTMQKAKLADENQAISALLQGYPLTEKGRALVSAKAHAIVKKSRSLTAERGTLDAFMQEFGLSNQEGVALMCLAEALLRIPDSQTQNKLIAEKLSSGNWGEHRGQSDNMFVNASVWALMLTGGVVKLDKKTYDNPANWVKGMIGKMGEPVIREATNKAMKIMGGQFVFGRDMEEALTRKEKANKDRQLFSFDMLGEGARTQDAADRYQELYLKAIKAVGEDSKNTASKNHWDKSSVSIKLSALHPRYDHAQSKRVMAELLPRLKEQALLAKSYDINLTIDAEEADRLELSLEIFEALAKDPDLDNWQGLGLVVQAYQKRAIYVLNWLENLSNEIGRTFPVRLVKGAYWDTEIKHAQELGLNDYPVWTRKASTDISYIVCAAKMLGAKHAFYCQFATHNAYTIAAIAQMASKDDIERMEFQKLHGMGDVLYNATSSELSDKIIVRTYAPVGRHEDLLPYLVRRLLENGANSSFVNRFMDQKTPIEEIIKDPFETVTGLETKRHHGIPKPIDLYSDRKNSVGFDLKDNMAFLKLSAKIDAIPNKPFLAHSIINGEKCGIEGVIINNPTNGEEIGRAYYAADAEIDNAIEMATGAQVGWNEIGGEKRAEILEKVGDLIEENSHIFLNILTKEAGKTIEDGVSEVREAADFCRFYAKEARKNFAEPQVLEGPTGERNEISLHGRGVFFCIAPWNFPLAIFTGQVAAALAAGNTVLAKPAEQTPYVASKVIELFIEAGVPTEVLHLILGKGSKIGAKITPDLRIQGISLTGSTATAKIINKTLAEKDGPINRFIAETGGQNVMIVDSSALPEQVSDDVMRSAFGSAGQRCSALRVLYIQDSIADKVITMLKGAIAELGVGDPALLSTDIGPIIDQGERAGLLKHIERMNKEATFIAKANLPDGFEHGSFLAPHMYEIPSMSMLTEEEFGPILHVVRFSANDLDSVMQDIVKTGYGLTFGVHSRIEGRWQELFKKHKVGNTYINRNIIGAVVGVQPFGGEGLSGTGPKAGGPHYLYSFACERVMSVNTAAIGGNTDLFQLNENN